MTYAIHTGLGKTTLAHVAARHCGYRPVEINASDDRSAASITTLITDAVHSKSVLGSKRPNCVILDEVDGALGEHSTAVQSCYCKWLELVLQRSVLIPTLCGQVVQTSAVLLPP